MFEVANDLYVIHTNVQCKSLQSYWLIRLRLVFLKHNYWSVIAKYNIVFMKSLKNTWEIKKYCLMIDKLFLEVCTVIMRLNNNETYLSFAILFYFYFLLEDSTRRKP